MVHHQDGLDRLGRVAAELLIAEVHVSRHQGDDGQPLQRHPVERALADPPGHERFAARALAFAAENAAAREDFRRPRFDIFAAQRRVRRRRAAANHECEHPRKHMRHRHSPDPRL